MATNNQFSIAIHIMVGLGYGHGTHMCSGELAESVNANASFIRRILSKLSKAGLVETTTGKSGACSLSRSAEKISMLDIYEAVDAPRVFAIHDYVAQKECTISCNIKPALEKVLDKAQLTMEETLRRISLADVISDTKKK